MTSELFPTLCVCQRKIRIEISYVIFKGSSWCKGKLTLKIEDSNCMRLSVTEEIPVCACGVQVHT